ncbi:MAG: adenylate/guanylate cyclase domain-containing protein [Hyphomicrobiales bacterium]
MSRIVGLALLAALIALRILDPVVVTNLRNQAFDLYQRIKPREISKQPVSIIDIDDASLAEIGQWPWPRSTIADLLTKATQGGAVAIALDIVFSEKDRLSPKNIAENNPNFSDALRAELSSLPSNDAILAEAISKSRIVLGQTSLRSNHSKSNSEQAIPEVQQAFLGKDPTPYLLKFPDLLQNLPEFEKAGAGRGVFTVRPDPDGIHRRLPLVMMMRDKIRLGLATELLRVATGGDAFAVRTDDAGISGVVVAKQLLRTDHNGSVWPYFSPSSRTRFVSAADLLTGKMPATRLRGHLVFVGTSAIGLEDFRANPTGIPMPGVEIHAQVLENIMSKTLLVRPNYAVAVELVVITALGLLVILLVPALGALLTIGGTLVLMGGYIGVSYYYFDTERLLLDPAYPTVAALVVILLMASANYIREERQRREIRSAFGQYVSPALVSQLADNPEQLKLGGETKDLSVLFSDVRGFTTIAESFKENPQGLTQLMNDFLGVLSDAILHHRGTIDKFMGDAVMAFWNAPLDEKDHAGDSCRAALKMMADVEQLNQQRKAEAEDGEEVLPINVGIGINTGSCVVGNMGSGNRFDYTALGDTVNLGSRLEGQSKTYGVDIVLGALTAKAVSDRFAVLELDLIRVKGKNEPERIFGLFGDETMAENTDFKAVRALNKSMLTAYRNQDWASAFDAVGMLREVDGRLGLRLDDYLFLYETRIGEFGANPPGQYWDGVYTATSK